MVAVTYEMSGKEKVWTEVMVAREVSVVVWCIKVVTVVAFGTCAASGAGVSWALDLVIPNSTARGNTDPSKAMTKAKLTSIHLLTGFLAGLVGRSSGKGGGVAGRLRNSFMRSEWPSGQSSEALWLKG